ncbi:MAG: alpha-2-macroglobulin family protein [Bacteroidales bacterium]|nr:alpha-2-macroglobulin family protein [Bacteroidales bacterium]
MKKFLVSTTVFFLLALPAYLVIAESFNSADHISLDALWKKATQEKEEDLPKSAISTFSEIRNIARKTNNDTALIKALNEQLNIEQRIYQGDYNTLAPEIEKQAMQSNNPVEQAFLYSKAADLYLSYYLQNQWRINRRPEIQETKNLSFDDWNSSQFIDTIYSVSERSFVNDTLKTIPINGYTELLSFSDIPEASCPTLYDLFVSKAIARLKSFYTEKAQSSVQNNILALYDKLITFDKETKKTNAFIYNTLQKSSYMRARGIISGEELLKQITGLEKEYRNSPYITNIILSKINFYTEQGNKEAIDSAYQIAKTAVKEFASVPGIEKIERRLNEITEPLFFPSGMFGFYDNREQNLPHIQNPFYFSYKNIDSLVISFYTLTESPVSLNNNIQFTDTLLPSAIFKENFSVSLKNDSPYWQKEDSTRFPSLPVGLYQYKIQVFGGDSTFSQYYLLPISNLATVSRRYENGDANCWVVTAGTGKPVKDADIIFYKLNDEGNLTEVARTKTDKNGLATQGEVSERWTSFRVCYKNDTVSLPRILPYFYRPQKKQIAVERENIYFFTDRSIYRPGEIVYFKGILVKQLPDGEKSMSHIPVEITLSDPRGKEITKTHFTTNDYGSVNGTFRIPDTDDNDGYYRIASKYGEISFRVEHYKRPSFEITLTEDSIGYLPGRNVIVQGNVRAYSGQPLQNATYRFRVTATDLYSPRIMPPFYQREQLVTSGEGTCNSEGNFTIGFLALPDSGAYRTMVIYTITGNITDSRGETQTFEKSVTIGKERLWLNGEIKELINKDNDLRLLIKGTNIQGAQIGVNGTFELLHLTEKDTLSVYKSSFTGGTEIVADVINNMPSGQYIIRAKGISSARDTATWEQKVILYGTKDKRPPVDTTLWVVENNTELLPSKDASVIVGSSRKPLYLLYELYGTNGLIERKMLKLSNKNTTLKIPYGKNTEKGAAVLLTCYYNKKLIQKQIRLTRPSTVIKPSVIWESWRNKLYPGENDSIVLRITDQQGKGIASEVLATMYDYSLNALYPLHWYLNPSYRPDFIFVPQFTDYNPRPYPLMLRSAKAATGTVTANTVADVAPIIAEEEVVETYSAQGNMSDNTDFIRSDFAPTAFFYPDMVSNADGTVSFSYKMPQSLTTWNMMILASTKEGSMGMSSKLVQTRKEVMVSPLLPRFIREGDSVTIRTSIINLLPQIQEVTFTSEFYNPVTKKILFTESRQVALPASAEKTMEVPLTLHNYTGKLGCRFKAVSKHHADGMEEEIDVLPSYTSVKEGESIELKGKQNHIFSVSSASGIPQQFRLEVCNNLIAYVVRAIPGLAQPQNDDAISCMGAFYTAAITQHLLTSYPELASAVKDKIFAQPNQAGYLRTRAAEQLKMLQNNNGGWSWFAGMPSSASITLKVLGNMARLTEMGAIEYNQAEKEMQIQALNYLDKWIEKQYNEIKDKSKYRLNKLELEYLYIRSLYRDIPEQGDSREAIRYFTKLAETQWKGKALSGKVMTAMLMKANGNEAASRLIIRSIGQYPLPEDVSSATLLLNFYGKQNIRQAEIDALIRFILKNKKSNVWRSPAETMNALYALCEYGTDKKTQPGSFRIISDKKILAERDIMPLVIDSVEFSYGQFGEKGEKVEFVNQSESTLWISAVRIYKEPLVDMKSYSNGISVERQYYKTTQSASGTILTPIEEGTPVQIGDKITVRLKVTTPEQRSFVRIRDYFPANLSNEAALSGTRFIEGSWVYASQSDLYKSFYVEQLNKGTSLFEYNLYAAFDGECRGGFAEAESLYAEEFGGHTKSTLVTIE